MAGDKVLRRPLGAGGLPDGSVVEWELKTSKTRTREGTGASARLSECVRKPGERFSSSTWMVGSTPDVETAEAGGYHAFGLSFVPASRVTEGIMREADARAVDEARRLVARRRDVLKVGPVPEVEPAPLPAPVNAPPAPAPVIVVRTGLGVEVARIPATGPLPSTAPEPVAATSGNADGWEVGKARIYPRTGGGFRVAFPTRPPLPVRIELKEHGFRWNPMAAEWSGTRLPARFLPAARS